MGVPANGANQLQEAFPGLWFSLLFFVFPEFSLNKILFSRIKTESQLPNSSIQPRALQYSWCRHCECKKLCPWAVVLVSPALIQSLYIMFKLWSLYIGLLFSWSFRTRRGQMDRKNCCFLYFSERERGIIFHPNSVGVNSLIGPRQLTTRIATKAWEAGEYSRTLTKMGRQWAK